MKKILKWLIPCLVASFMVLGLCQTSSFTFAEGVQSPENTTQNVDEQNTDDELDTDVDNSSSEVVNVGPAAAFSVFAGRTSDEQEPTEPVDTMVPEHHKTLTGNEADGYSITLDVTGKQQTIPGQKPKVDVVLVIDKSGSMSWAMAGQHQDGDSRMSVLKSIVTGEGGLTSTILGDTNLDARMAVVAYSGNDDSGLYNDAQVVSNWTSNYDENGNFIENSNSSINSSVNALSANGGTNCEAGLRSAAELLTTKRADAQTYLIFLSDGQPTFYYANGKDYYQSNGYSLNFTEQKIPEGIENPNDENISEKQYGSHIIYGDYIDWDGWTPVRKTGWHSITERTTGWHYVDGKWAYGKYEYKEVVTKDLITAGTTLGDGNSDKAGSEIPDPGDKSGICSSRAYDQAAAISGLAGFYTVGISNDASSTFLSALPGKTDAANQQYFPGANAEDLKAAFVKIGQSIKDRALTISNVVITDGLTDYVNITGSVAADGTISNVIYTIKDENGIDVTATENVNAQMHATYNAETKTVSCEFAQGYSLKKNYTYAVTFGIEPTQKAYTEYSTNGGNYKDATGFASNTEAKLSYKFGDNEQAEVKYADYVEEPVIQVSANKLSVTKEVKGGFANKEEEFSFTLTLKDETGKVVSGTFGNTTFNDKGQVSFTLKDGDTQTFENLPRNYSYVVEEDSNDEYVTTYLTGTESDSNKPSSTVPSGEFTLSNKDGISVTVINTKEAVPLTGITDNAPKGLGMIGTIVAELVAIAFVLKKKRQLKM
ncbi:MAG: VWA domain-containing protein [Floccifex sp.]